MKQKTEKNGKKIEKKPTACKQKEKKINKAKNKTKILEKTFSPGSYHKPGLKSKKSKKLPPTGPGRPAYDQKPNAYLGQDAGPHQAKQAHGQTERIRPPGLQQRGARQLCHSRAYKPVQTRYDQRGGTKLVDAAAKGFSPGSWLQPGLKGSTNRD